MATDLVEEKICFSFGDGWRPVKWDGERAYRDGLGGVTGCKAVDFCALHDGAVYLIEVKDFRGHRIENKPRVVDQGSDHLADELAHKVCDTVAGLLGAHRSRQSEDTWTAFAQALADRKKDVRVVLWLEEDVPHGPDRRMSFADRLEQKLRWLTPKAWSPTASTRSSRRCRRAAGGRSPGWSGSCSPRGSSRSAPSSASPASRRARPTRRARWTSGSRSRRWTLHATGYRRSRTRGKGSSSPSPRRRSRRGSATTGPSGSETPCSRARSRAGGASGQPATGRRTTSPPNVAPLLLPAIAAVRRRHPLVRVVLVETERRLEPRRDEIDLFLRVGAVVDERLVARPIGAYPHVLVASEGYLARRGTPHRPEDLATHDVIAFGSRTVPTQVDLVPTRRGTSVRVSLAPVLATNDYGTILEAARADMGIAEVPAFLRSPTAGLVRGLPTWTLGEVSIHLLFASDRMLSKTVRAVLDALATSVPSRLRASSGESPR